MTEQEMRDKAIAWAIERLKKLFNSSRISNIEEAQRSALMMRTLTGEPWTCSKYTYGRGTSYVVHIPQKNIQSKLVREGRIDRRLTKRVRTVDGRLVKKEDMQP